ncbi:MAG: hypothetical protein ABIC95_05685 [archaeon]
MEEYEAARLAAGKHLKIADHMLTQTYKLVRDPKILLAVAENLYKSVSASIDAILSWERLYKRIPPYPSNPESKIQLFAARSIRRYGFPDSYAKLAQRLHEVIERHRKAPVEFSRKKTFVICDDDYDIKALTEDELKVMLVTAFDLATAMQHMVTRNERVLRKRDGRVQTR